MKIAEGRMTRRIWAAAIVFGLIAGAAISAEQFWRPDLRGTPLFDEPGFHTAIGVVASAALIVLAAGISMAASALSRQNEQAESDGADADQP